MKLLRLATRRVDKPGRVGTPLDGPAAILNGQVLGFRNEAQHLETSVSRLPFVALSDSLLADFRPSWAHTNSVIGPLIRQRNRISRQRGGNVVLAGLLDGGQVRSYDQKS
jgi:hypothetical protein